MSVIRKRASEWASVGLQANESLALAAYVDNVYSVSRDVAGAVAILEDFEAHLWQDWRLAIKPSSRAALVPAGGRVDEAHDHVKWPLTDLFVVLGHRLHNSGSAWPCLRATKQSMWRAFYASCGSQSCRQLPPKLQVRTLLRCVLPICDFRAARWAYHETLAEDIDRTQRKMMSILARIPRQTGESDNIYFRRRRRQISTTCTQSGLWSLRFANRVCSWDAHLHREANQNSWAAKLLRYHGEEWLAARRSRFGGAFGPSGRTCTRILPGAPCPRWHDGVTAAHHALSRPE